MTMAIIWCMTSGIHPAAAMYFISETKPHFNPVNVFAALEPISVASDVAGSFSRDDPLAISA